LTEFCLSGGENRMAEGCEELDLLNLAFQSGSQISSLAHYAYDFSECSALQSDEALS
jgi:hypothetical protein